MWISLEISRLIRSLTASSTTLSMPSYLQCGHVWNKEKCAIYIALASDFREVCTGRGRNARKITCSYVVKIQRSRFGFSFFTLIILCTNKIFIHFKCANSNNTLWEYYIWNLLGWITREMCTKRKGCLGHSTTSVDLFMNANINMLHGAC
jgi:hypothetical protein